MQVADREDLRRLCQIGADLRPQLRPAVVGSAKKREKLGLHPLVFQAKVLLIDTGPLCQPGLKMARGFDDIHGGNDSDGGNRKSNGGKQENVQHGGTEKTKMKQESCSLCLHGDEVEGLVLEMSGIALNERLLVLRDVVDREDRVRGAHRHAFAPQSMHSAGSTKS